MSSQEGAVKDTSLVSLELADHDWASTLQKKHLEILPFNWARVFVFVKAGLLHNPGYICKWSLNIIWYWKLKMKVKRSSRVQRPGDASLVH